MGRLVHMYQCEAISPSRYFPRLTLPAFIQEVRSYQQEIRRSYQQIQDLTAAYEEAPSLDLRTGELQIYMHQMRDTTQALHEFLVPSAHLPLASIPLRFPSLTALNQLTKHLDGFPPIATVQDPTVPSPDPADLREELETLDSLYREMDMQVTAMLDRTRFSGQTVRRTASR